MSGEVLKKAEALGKTPAELLSMGEEAAHAHMTPSIGKIFANKIWKELQAQGPALQASQPASLAAVAAPLEPPKPITRSGDAVRSTGDLRAGGDRLTSPRTGGDSADNQQVLQREVQALREGLREARSKLEEQKQQLEQQNAVIQRFVAMEARMNHLAEWYEKLRANVTKLH